MYYFSYMPFRSDKNKQHNDLGRIMTTVRREAEITKKRHTSPTRVCNAMLLMRSTPLATKQYWY